MMSTRLIKRFISVTQASRAGNVPPDQGSLVQETEMKKTEQPASSTETGTESHQEYFRREQQKRMDILRGNLQDEIDFHQDQIKKHQEAVDYYKKEFDGIKPPQ